MAQFFPTAKSIQKGQRDVKELVQSLRERDIEVAVQSSENVDDDFCTLVQVPHKHAVICASMSAVLFYSHQSVLVV